NHEKHNIDFFYALLVVRKNRAGIPRYAIKHFIFRRNDQTVYEIPPKTVRVVDMPALRPYATTCAEKRGPPTQVRPSPPNLQRAKDQEFFGDFYPDLKPLISKGTGAPYWRGPLALVDGSRIEIVTMESTDGAAPSYSIATSSKNPVFADVLARCQER